MNRNTLLRGVGVFTLAFLLSLEYWSLYISAEDEAVVVVGSRRILEGQQIYRDWDTHLSPGSFLLGALWFGALGFQTPSARLAFACIFAATAVVVDLISQRCFKGAWQALPVFLWGSCGIAEFPIFSYHWLASGMAVTALWRGLIWVDRPDRKNALLVGSAVAGAGWFLQSEGLMGVLMVTAWSLRFRLRSAGWAALGCLGTSLVLWLPVCGQWGHIARDTASLGSHFSVHHKPYSLENLNFFLRHYEGLSPAIGGLAFTAGASHIFINVLRYLGFPILLLWTLMRSEQRRDKSHLALAYGMLGWLLGTANRQTVLYLSFLNPGWVLLMTLGLYLLPGGRWWALALALVEGPGWGARLLFKQQIYAYPVSTRAGVYYLADPQAAEALRNIHSWLNEIPPNTPVLAFPYSMSFYWLENLRNPTRRQTLVPDMDPQAEIDRALADVQTQKVPWILYIAPYAAEVQGDLSIPADRINQSWEELRRRFTQGYRLKHEVGGASFYELVPKP